MTSITIGKLYQSGIKKGFIITKIDNESISSVDKMIELLEEKEGGVLIEGINPNGTKAYFGFGL